MKSGNILYDDSLFCSTEKIIFRKWNWDRHTPAALAPAVKYDPQKHLKEHTHTHLKNVDDDVDDYLNVNFEIIIHY